jgi:hypothetical protein
MPITSYSEKDKDLTIFKVIGMLSYETAMAAIKVFYKNNPTKHVLWDAISATDVLFTPKEVEAIVKYKERYVGKRGTGKTAIVAQRDIIFGLSRMFEVQSRLEKAPYDIMVFRSIDEAHQWLDES